MQLICVVKNILKNGIYIFQKGFNYSQDGPGNRLVYHLSGCNLFCPWCSNPEGLEKGNNAIFVSAENIVKEAESCRMMFFDSGGITFTGGECSLQKNELLPVIRELKKCGIHTCIETNVSLKNCEELYSEVDYMIADCKCADSVVLKDVTGADFDTVYGNLLFRAKTKKPLLIRIPLIKGFNTGSKNAELLADSFIKIQNNSKSENVFFEILTYHEFGKEKYKKLGKEYKVNDAFVSKDDVLTLKNALTKYNLKIITT